MALAHPGGHGKKAVKRLWCGGSYGEAEICPIGRQQLKQINLIKRPCIYHMELWIVCTCNDTILVVFLFCQLVTSLMFSLFVMAVILV